jgi:hypothetical protein
VISSQERFIVVGGTREEDPMSIDITSPLVSRQRHEPKRSVASATATASGRSYFGGAKGALTALSADDIGWIHDRHIPGRRSGFDVLAVGPAGVYVIDDKRTESIDPCPVREERPAEDPERSHLLVGGEVKDNLLHWLELRVERVRRLLADAGQGEVPVIPVLCFEEASLPRRKRAVCVRGTVVVGPSGVPNLVRGRGRLSTEDCIGVLTLLDQAFPAEADAA